MEANERPAWEIALKVEGIKLELGMTEAKLDENGDPFAEIPEGLKGLIPGPPALGEPPNERP